MEFEGGARELYNLEKDPYQLENLAHETDPDFVEALSSRLAQLANCKAAQCRRLENSPVAH